MSQTELPAVAKNFYTLCKKCEAERYHVVLAHTSEKSAKIKCEVCGSVKSYTLPKARKASTTSAAKAPGAAKTGTGRGGRRGKNSEESRRAAHQSEYEGLLQTHDAKPTQAYSMKGKFELNHKLNHPKFGLGVIRAIQQDKIEVVFQDEIRSLIHNRP